MKRESFYVLLLAASGALVYANALTGPFIYDDGPYILNNEGIRQLWPPNWASLEEAGHPVVNGRPLTSFSLALNYALGGYDVKGYHLFNIAVHILCCLALYGAARQLFGRIGELAPRAAELALVGAILWGVHPLNSEVVNYTVQRSAALMALCYCGTLYCFLRGVSAGGRGWLVGAVVCCFLGMAAKEVMVSAPLLVLICDVLFVAGTFRAALQQRWKLYGGLALSWLVLLRGMLTMPHGETISFGHEITGWVYLLNQARMITTYIGLVFWPHPLALDYGAPLPLTLADIWLQGLLVTALVLLSGLAVCRRWRWGLVGALVFAALAPTSSFVPILTEVGAERRMYLPLAALSVGLVAAGYIALRRWAEGPRIGLVFAGLAVVLLGWTTLQRNKDYADKVSIWKSSVAAVPDNPRALYNFANELAAIGDAAGALENYRRVLAIDSGYVEVHYNLGQLFMKQGHIAKAIDHYRRAAELDAHFIDAHINLGIALVKADRLPEALPYFERAVLLEPELPEARYNLALALERAGVSEEAMVHYGWLAAADPGDVVAHYRSALIDLANGRKVAAIARLRRVVALDPHHAEAHYHLGRALIALDSTATGMAHRRRAFELDPSLVELEGGGI